ncbi:hypothetical protein QG37_04151 [Candidozyma auris]|nr:hypothetical protein QG37_04151 [[Candida] auris]
MKSRPSEAGLVFQSPSSSLIGGVLETVETPDEAENMSSSSKTLGNAAEEKLDSTAGTFMKVYELEVDMGARDSNKLLIHWSSEVAEGVRAVWSR